MRHQVTPAGSGEHRTLQRAIVGALLGEDHEERWSCDELAARMRADRSALDAALERLRDEGVVLLDGEDVLASPCARHLDALGLVGV